MPGQARLGQMLGEVPPSGLCGPCVPLQVSVYTLTCS